MAKGTKKLGAPKAAAVGINAANMFAAIEKMDGNPQSPTEFDDSPHDGDEVYFKADEEESEVRSIFHPALQSPLRFGAIYWPDPVVNAST